MARYGLVRPVEGRYFAGVCASIGRATNTDPVLWRVLFAVLTLFGGVGLLAYLIGWLLIPADGDTASPVEAVLGRGVSRTSAPVAVIGAVLAILVFALVASEGLRPAVVGALVVLGAAVLLSRGMLQRPGSAGQGQASQQGWAQHFGPPPMVPPSPQQSASAMFGHPASGSFGSPASGSFGQPAGLFGSPAGEFGQPAGAAAPFATPATATPAAAAPFASPASAEPTATPASDGATVQVPAGTTDAPDSELTVQKPSLAETGPGGLPEQSEESRSDTDEFDEVGAGRAHAVTSDLEGPTMPQPAAPPQPQALSYGQPFAPHGPFAPPGPYPPAFGPVPQTQTRRLPLYGPYPPIPGAGLPWDAPVSADPMSHYPGLPYSGPPAQQPKPKVKRPKSRLGKVTLYATAIALGTLATVHLLGASIAGSAYFAVALAIVGLGLVAGAWVGRARLLIPLGFALSLGLLISTASSIDGPHRAGRPELLMPTTIDELNANNPFPRDTGDITIDLTQIDFTDQQISFEASLDVGKIRVILPPNVDVTAKAKVEVGDARVLTSSWGGLSDRWRTVVDHGVDGPGGGNLQLTLSVDVGNLEVVR